MTVGELAKKRGEPVGEFVKKIQKLGFEAGSHAKKLTQKDLDVLIGLLEVNPKTEQPREVAPKEIPIIENPNVLLIKLTNGKRAVVLVDASVSETGVLDLKVVNQSVEDSIGEALLEFRKQMGMHMGVN
jgi:hypothetical protein